MSEINKALDNADHIGCIGAILHFFLCLPAWLYILHHLLSSVDTPASVWAAFWVYAPAILIAAIMAQLHRTQELKALRAANQKEGAK